jgi:hypothetical protein
LSPDDKVLRQGFWDAISLVSQSRTEAGHAAEEVVQAHQQPSPRHSHTSTAHK